MIKQLRKYIADFLRRPEDLPDVALDKLRMLAELRGEEPTETFRRIATTTVRNLIPKRIAERDVVLEKNFTSLGIEDGLVKIVLDNGRVLYTWPSKLKYIRLYYLLKDLLPPEVKPETYVGVVDADYRYKKAGGHSLLPGEGGVVIEAGAYTGHKAIRWAEGVGKTGKVIAIEIDRDNYRVLEKNVRANNLQDVVSTYHCGIWNKKGEMVDHHADRIYHSLVDIEEHAWNQETVVPTDTLDNIFRQEGVDEVDFLNMQINGAEIEALEGTQEYFDRVKVWRIAAYFSVNGRTKAQEVCEYLQQRGCVILQRTARYGGNITAIGKNYVDQFSEAIEARKAEAGK